MTALWPLAALAGAALAFAGAFVVLAAAVRIAGRRRRVTGGDAGLAASVGESMKGF